MTLTEKQRAQRYIELRHRLEQIASDIDEDMEENGNNTYHNKLGGEISAAIYATNRIAGYHARIALERGEV